MKKEGGKVRRQSKEEAEGRVEIGGECGRGEEGTYCPKKKKTAKNRKQGENGGKQQRFWICVIFSIPYNSLSPVGGFGGWWAWGKTIKNQK